MANQNQEALKEACAKESKNLEQGMYEYIMFTVFVDSVSIRNFNFCCWYT